MAQKQISLVLKKMIQDLASKPNASKEIIAQYAKYLVKNRLVKNSLALSNSVLGAIELLTSITPILVTSAKELSASEKIAILDFINLKFSEQNKEISYIVNPEMIAGVRIDSRIQSYNFSLNRNLATIRSSIK